MRRLRAAVELLNSNDEVVDAGAVGAVGPLASITDAVDFIIQADGAALGDTQLEMRRTNMS